MSDLNAATQRRLDRMREARPAGYGRTHTWQDLLAGEMSGHREKLDDVVHLHLPEKVGGGFVAWTEARVYASWEYDGSDEVISLPRNPPTP